MKPEKFTPRMLATPVRFPMGASSPIVVYRNGFFRSPRMVARIFRRRHLPFAQRVLRGRGVGFPGVTIRHARTVAEGPDTRPLGNFQILVDEDPAPRFRAGQRVQEGVRGGPGRPDQRIGRDRRPIAERDVAVRHGDDFTVRMDFHLVAP